MTLPAGWRCLVTMIAMLVAGAPTAPARAQSPDRSPRPAAASPTLLGGGIWSRPAYLGSDERVSSPIPIIRYYGKPWFARTTQGMLEAGARVVFTSGLSLGAQLAYESGRPNKDSDFLTDRGVTTLPISASVGLHAAWDLSLGPAPTTVLLRLRREVDSERGAQADLRASVGVYGGDRLRLGVFAQASWADAESNQAYYGVSVADAVRTGLPVFSAAAGMAHGAAGLLWSYDLNSKWMLQGIAEARRLSSDLSASPLTQVRDNTYASAGLAYRF